MTLSQLHREDEAELGGIVLGWMTKIVAIGAIVGVVGFDGISVGISHLNTTDDANTAVQAASQSYQTTHSVQQAYDAAVAAVKPGEAVLQSDFTVSPDGTTTLTVTNTAKTLLLYRSKSTSKWAAITVHATGKFLGQ